MPSLWQHNTWSPELSIMTPQPGQGRKSNASKASPVRILASRVQERDERSTGPSSELTMDVMSVARCAALSVCSARRRSGAVSLKCTSSCVFTCACHQFCFNHAASISSGSTLSSASMFASDATFKWRLKVKSEAGS